MDKRNQNILIIFETHMNDRYDYFSKKNNLKVFNANLNNNSGRNILIDFFEKIKFKKELLNKYDSLKTFIIDNRLKSEDFKIYVSNSEGYVAHNFLKFLQKDFPTLEIIAMQHGIMPLYVNVWKMRVRTFINQFLYYIFGIYLYGTGFGIKLANKYIVYNKTYKEILLQFGWRSEDIIVNYKFLKPDLYDYYITHKTLKKEDNDIAIFLPQCLSLAKICTQKEERELHIKAIDYIAKKHKKVLIKLHPACNNIDFVLKQNIEFINDLKQGFLLSSCAYSFFSTALLDAQIFDVKTIAFKSKLFDKKNDLAIYDLFSAVEVI